MNQNLIRLAIIGGIALFLLLIFANSMFLTIKSGERGVLFKRFGGGLAVEKTYDQGFKVIAPWNNMFIYEVRFHKKDETMKVLSSNGLSIEVEVSIRYKPIDDRIGYLHNEFGYGYEDKLIIPEIRAATRKVIGKYTPEELYSTKREAVQTEIIEATETVLNAKNVLLDVVLIRSVELPETIKAAIEKKLKQEQESQEYAFKIEKESKEAERKRIEAQGINDFQRIITQGISDKLLRWKGIEATMQIAESPNAKVVIIGSGKDGLPIILGN